MFDLAFLLAKAQPGFSKALAKHPWLCAQGCLAFRPGIAYLQLWYPSVKHLHYFSYCEWDASQIVQALHADTPWRLPADVASDWHSDCRFHVLKEYMFQKMMGVSYTDAYLSNQIRHGLMSRAEGLSELHRSKRFFAAELPRTLEVLGLGHVADRCDTSCFALE